MKVGDIVYFKSVYIAKYTSGEYHFKPGDRYRKTLSFFKQSR